jgi:hippurate hydrolase
MGGRIVVVVACCVATLGLSAGLADVETVRKKKSADAAALKALAADVEKRIAAEVDSLEALYKHLHEHPELSLQEEKTAARLAKELRELGFEVTEGVGGHGVVAVLKNGPGPVVLVRADMDALPIVEKTNLAYASKVRAKDRRGTEVGVMHACGHDMHMTCWVGAARVLHSLKNQWQGTLVFVAQPAEEIGAGARMMLEAGLYKKFPKPDYAIALHCDSKNAHGHVAFTEGLAMANVDSVDVVVKGKGGHGAFPHTTVDPVVLAARIVLDLQTIVSREISPTDPAVITVGSIHGGTKHNVIPNEVHLQITVRTMTDSVRKHVHEAIQRIVKSAADGARAPEPEITFRADEFTPALNNDPKLTRRLVGVFREVLGEDRVHERPALMGGEDFARFAEGGTPIFLYWLGTLPPEVIADSRREGGKPLVSMHSDQYYPIPKPTIRTGVLTMSMAVLHLLEK